VTNNEFGSFESVFDWITEEPTDRPTLDDPECAQHNGNGAYDSDYYDNYFAKHGIEIVEKRACNDSTMYLPRCCPFDPTHHGGSSVAFFVNAQGVLGFKCQHLPGCAGKTGRDVRDKFEPGWRNASSNGSSNGSGHGSGTNDQPKVVIGQIPSVFADGEVELKWVIENFLAEAAILLLSGDSGSGKSSLTSAIAYAISSGVETFIGHACHKRRVLVLDLENDKPYVQERFKRLHLKDGPDFQYWGNWEDEPPADPADPRILEWAKACEVPPVIIVDSLRAFLDGKDENDSAVCRHFFDKFKPLTRLGCAIIVIHHGGRNENNKQWRGSADIKASVTAAYYIENGGGCDHLGPLQLFAFKARARIEAEIRIRVTEEGEFWLENFPADEPPQPTAADKLKKLLLENPGVNSRDFDATAKRYRISRDTARNVRSKWIKEKRIRVETIFGTKERRYWLVEEPEADGSDEGFRETFCDE
jgi:hypothetical protein